MCKNKKGPWKHNFFCFLQLSREQDEHLSRILQQQRVHQLQLERQQPSNQLSLQQSPVASLRVASPLVTPARGSPAAGEYRISPLESMFGDSFGKNLYIGKI